jgi:hypothetical protein
MVLLTVLKKISKAKSDTKDNIGQKADTIKVK